MKARTSLMMTTDRKFLSSVQTILDVHFRAPFIVAIKGTSGIFRYCASRWSQSIKPPASSYEFEAAELLTRAYEAGFIRKFSVPILEFRSIGVK